MTKRVMIYGASIAGGGVATFTNQISSTLHDISPALGWQLSVLGKTTDNAKHLINWPKSVFESLHEQKAQETEAAYFNADIREFQQIFDKVRKPFDVLYL